MRTYKNTLLLIGLLLVASALRAQQLTMQFAKPFRGTVKLIGYNGLVEKTLATKQLNGSTDFVMDLPKSYRGMAMLDFEAMSKLFLIVNKEDIAITVGDLKTMQPLEFSASLENNLLNEYVAKQGLRVAKRNGITYLLPYYQQDPNDSLRIALEDELNAINQQEQQALDAMPQKSYVKFYVPFRQLVENQRNAMRAKTPSANLTTLFYEVDIAGDDFWHSGIIEPFLEGQIALSEMQGNMQAINAACQRLTDHIYAQLKKQPYKLLDLSERLLALYEKRGLTDAAEYLSTLLLNDKSIDVQGDLMKKMEQYRAMKEGAKAADITFSEPIGQYKTLKSIKTPKLLFFWKSGCAGCKEAIPEIKERYGLLQQYGVTVIGLSLDTQKGKFNNYKSTLPWPNRCDYKGWDSPIVDDYFIYGTPLFFLLDGDNTILQKPRSMAELEQFVKANLKPNY